MSIEQRDVNHIFERLRSGVVPERSLDAFAVGVEKESSELARVLDLAVGGEGLFKCLRGGYGCGKTFMGRLAVQHAQAQGFATSFVVVSENDLRFHRFDEVYQRVVSELGTGLCPRGALGEVLDRWIARLEEGLIALGATEDSPDFDNRVRQKLDEQLSIMTGGSAPQDMARVIRAIFDLKQRGELVEAGALISWLAGSPNVAASAKRAANIKGDIGSRDALAYLRGILEIVKAAGHKGLLIVVDELETVLRARKDVREKSLNGLRQIIDAAKDFPGLLWVFTGTPEFFDTRRGVAGLAPLHDRLRFESQGRFVSLRQPQLELRPFDANRLREVALKLRGLYPSRAPDRHDALVTREFIDRLVAEVSAGLGGDVGVVPRLFLRSFVGTLDIVDEHADYNPMRELGFHANGLSPEELRSRNGQSCIEQEPGDEDGYQPTPVDF